MWENKSNTRNLTNTSKENSINLHQHRSKVAATNRKVRLASLLPIFTGRGWASEWLLVTDNHLLILSSQLCKITAKEIWETTFGHIKSFKIIFFYYYYSFYCAIVPLSCTQNLSRTCSNVFSFDFRFVPYLACHFLSNYLLCASRLLVSISSFHVQDLIRIRKGFLIDPKNWIWPWVCCYMLYCTLLLP